MTTQPAKYRAELRGDWSVSVPPDVLETIEKLPNEGQRAACVLAYVRYFACGTPYPERKGDAWNIAATSTRGTADRLLKNRRKNANRAGKRDTNIEETLNTSNTNIEEVCQEFALEAGHTSTPPHGTLPAQTDGARGVNTPVAGGVFTSTHTITNTQTINNPYPLPTRYVGEFQETGAGDTHDGPVVVEI